MLAGQPDNSEHPSTASVIEIMIAGARSKRRNCGPPQSVRMFASTVQMQSGSSWSIEMVTLSLSISRTRRSV